MLLSIDKTAAVETLTLWVTTVGSLSKKAPTRSVAKLSLSKDPLDSTRQLNPAWIKASHQFHPCVTEALPTQRALLIILLIVSRYTVKSSELRVMTKTALLSKSRKLQVKSPVKSLRSAKWDITALKVNRSTKRRLRELNSSWSRDKLSPEHKLFIGVFRKTRQAVHPERAVMLGHTVPDASLRL